MVANRLDGLDRLGMQELIRILVRRIEIDDERVEVVFRVPLRMDRPGLRPAMKPRVGDIAQASVERPFSWFGRNRRLAKDCQNPADTLAAFVILAAIQLGIRRPARTDAFEPGAEATAAEAEPNS